MTGGLPPGTNLFPDVVAVDSAKLEQAIETFRSAADATRPVAAESDDLTYGWSFGGAPWGSDPLGSAFGTEYVPAGQMFTKALDQLVELFDGIADQLTAVGGRFSAAETDATDLAKTFSRNG